ncbi:hypothetical protein EIN_086670 [Entamoeba invadens IP1]|uniref:hypothetical protein n=1 Tax=Entamoeba invadens IP1 TaxID=370355 RepID=UPI0002C3F8BC|nr:hypothetical protein EIN_086670 [Entamoeba invadens IP1]ELP85385.1 hypothetical protein EIN_086670 [Entamoeba invadens IP1]|eukprot:XP_004184731.1 hypothetical protein EIN_086670 [Entamoeba invadens IP1]
MSRSSSSRVAVQQITTLPQIPLLMKISCSSLSNLKKWGDEDIDKLKKEVSTMLLAVTSMKDNLQTQYNATLRSYKPHHPEPHTRQKPPAQQQNAVAVPEPILCVTNEPAREYWDNVVYPYVKYPKKKDYDDLLVLMDTNGENFDCPLGPRDDAKEFSVSEKLIEGIVDTNVDEYTRNMEDESTIRERLIATGITTHEELATINARSRKDDEISRELRKLNEQIIEKRKFINECRIKMQEYYKSVERKQFEFDGLQKEEKTYHCH